MQVQRPAGGVLALLLLLPPTCASTVAVGPGAGPQQPAPTPNAVGVPRPGGEGVDWVRGAHVRLTVAPNFTYTAVLSDGVVLSDGGLALRCGGAYQSRHNGGIRAVGQRTAAAGRHPRLGAFDEVSQRFAVGSAAAPCAEITASIRYLPAMDAFAFRLALPDGASGTLAYPTPRGGECDGGGLPLPNQWAEGRSSGFQGALPLASAFPSFRVPPQLDFMHTTGNMLMSNFGVGKMAHFAGGLYGGPLLVFNSTAPRARTGQLPTITLSPLTHHKAVFTSQAQEPQRGAGPFPPGPVNISDRVSVGVSVSRPTLAEAWAAFLRSSHQIQRGQGYIDSIPAGYEQEAVLAGRKTWRHLSAPTQSCGMTGIVAGRGRSRGGVHGVGGGDASQRRLGEVQPGGG